MSPHPWSDFTVIVNLTSPVKIIQIQKLLCPEKELNSSVLLLKKNRRFAY